MAVSLPDVSVKLVADISGFANDFKRAANVVNREMVRVEGEVDKAVKKISKKFTVGDIGKDILKGLGVGSGFAVAQQAADLMVDYFRQQADHAKSIEESYARQLDLTKQIIALRQTPEQQTAAMRKEYERMGKELERLRAPSTGYVAIPVITRSPVTQPVEKTNEQQLAIAKLTEEYTKLGLELEKIDKKTKESEVQTRARENTSDQTRRIAALTEGLKQQEIAFDELIKKQRDSNLESEKNREELERLAERYREVADPLRSYRKQLEEIERIRGRLSADEYNAATGNIRNGMVDTALDDFFGGMDKQNSLYGKLTDISDAARDLGFSFSSAFEEAVIGGNKLSDVLDGLLQDILRIFIRQSITAPLASYLTGAFTGMFRAAGGPVTSGQSYIVGEKGPEVFRPSGSGTIVPNHALTRGGDKSGNVYQIDARGTDESVIRRLEQVIISLAGPGVVERRAVAAQISTLRRGGSSARAVRG